MTTVTRTRRITSFSAGAAALQSHRKPTIEAMSPRPIQTSLHIAVSEREHQCPPARTDLIRLIWHDSSSAVSPQAVSLSALPRTSEQ